MEEIKTFWLETMEMQEARWIVAITGLVVGVSVAFYFVKLFRDMAIGGGEDPTSYISEFQRLRDEGKLDDEEYARLSQAIPKPTPVKVANANEKLPRKLPGGLIPPDSQTNDEQDELPDFKPDEPDTDETVD